MTTGHVGGTEAGTDTIRVVGGIRLEGEVQVTGAKNSVLKLMAAALLATGPTVLDGVPDIVDVRIMAELLRLLGAGATHDPVQGVVEIDVPDQPRHRADYDPVRAMPASISVLGPLVARVGEADVALPGGDAIGSRGLDLHVDGLRSMGAEVHVDHGYLVATAPSGGLRGTVVPLAFPSVGATENLLMAAVLADGRLRDRQRGPRARDRRPRRDAHRDGRPHLRHRHLAAGGRGRRPAVADPSHRRPGSDRRRHLVLRHRGRRR